MNLLPSNPSVPPIHDGSKNGAEGNSVSKRDQIPFGESLKDEMNHYRSERSDRTNPRKGPESNSSERSGSKETPADETARELEKALKEENEKRANAEALRAHEMIELQALENLNKAPDFLLRLDSVAANVELRNREGADVLLAGNASSRINPKNLHDGAMASKGNSASDRTIPVLDGNPQGKGTLPSASGNVASGLIKDEAGKAQQAHLPKDTANQGSTGTRAISEVDGRSEAREARLHSHQKVVEASPTQPHKLTAVKAADDTLTAQSQKLTAAKAADDALTAQSQKLATAKAADDVLTAQSQKLNERSAMQSQASNSLGRTQLTHGEHLIDSKAGPNTQSLQTADTSITSKVGAEKAAANAQASVADNSSGKDTGGREGRGSHRSDSGNESFGMDRAGSQAAGVQSAKAGAPTAQVNQAMQRIIESIEHLKQSHQQSQVSLSIDLKNGESLKVSLRLIRQQVKAVFSNESEAMRLALREGWEQLQKQVSEKGLEADIPEFTADEQDRGEQRSARRGDQRDSLDESFEGKQSKDRPSQPDHGQLDERVSNPLSESTSGDGSIRRYA